MKILAVLLLLLVLQPAMAYKVETHARLSQKAATCSVLAEQSFMEGLGLEGLEAKDPLWSQPIKKKDDESEKWFIEWIKEYKKTAYESTIKTLIGWGAKFEDEEFLSRPLNHFFDPVNGRPFHPCPFFVHCNTSPDWALEDGNPRLDLDDQGQSLFDANDRLRYALGLADKDAREQAWAGFFQSFGMVIHHIQDMSQPQHVRNDAHCDSFWCKLSGDYNPSYYEQYTNEHRKEILDQYACGSYPRLDPKKFSKARDFWINDNHYGMAEYTNWNFVSQGSNFHRSTNGIVANPWYPYPDPQNGGLGNVITKASASELPAQVALSGDIWFLGTSVNDNYSGNVDFNERTSSFSLWDDKLERHLANGTGWYRWSFASYNSLNFKAAYPFLLPRAIAYSAGLIDYFFRGRMKVSDVTYIGGDRVRITVTNTTAEENPGNAPFPFSGLSPNRPGRFYLYQDEADGSRWELPPVNAQDAELTYLEVFNAGDSMLLEFALSAVPGSPDFDLDKPLTLVYDGLIGEERGIAVASFSLSRLLAFDISRAGAGAPVPNIVDIYQSQDSGASWQPVASGIEIPISDTTPDYGDRLAVQAATYVGDGSVLFYPDYRNYDGFQPYTENLWAARLEQFGQTLGTAVPLDTATWLAGQGNNAADHNAVLRSLVYTGGHSLAALQTRHPDSGAAPPRIRTFGLLRIPDWTVSTAWQSQPGWGEGGLPQLSWLGGDRYTMSVYMECIEENPPCSPRNNKFGSALRATDDAGVSYYDLTSFTGECTQYDFFCIQFIRPLDDGRLLGWVTRRGTVDPGPVTLYVSSDGGVSWSVYATAPTPTACVGIDHPYVVVDDIVYLGSGHGTGQSVRDSLFIQATCNRINTDNAGQIFYGFEELSRNAFATADSGATWKEVLDPPHRNGRVIFAGDNGVVPGLQGP